MMICQQSPTTLTVPSTYKKKQIIFVNLKKYVPVIFYIPYLKFEFHFNKTFFFFFLDI